MRGAGGLLGFAEQLLRRGKVERLGACVALAQLFEEEEGGADGSVEVAVGGDGQREAGEALDMFGHRPVSRDPAAEDQLAMQAAVPGEEDVDEVFGQTETQAVADLVQAVALLLGVDEVRLGEDRAARGDLRTLALAAGSHGGEVLAAAQVQPPCLLVKETAGAGGAGGVAGAALVVAGLVEGGEAELFAADDEQTAEAGVKVAGGGDIGDLVVIAALRRHLGRARGSHREVTWLAWVELAQQVGRHLGDLAVMQGVALVTYPSRAIEKCQPDGNRADIQPHHREFACHQCFPYGYGAVAADLPAVACPIRFFL